MAVYLAAAQRQGVTVSKCYAQSRDMAAHGAVGVAARAHALHAAMPPKQAEASVGSVGKNCSGPA